MTPRPTIALISFSLFTCTSLFMSSPAFSADTIRIGIAAPLTGALAYLGIPIKNAATLVADKVNAKGGIMGRKIELIQKDDMCKPEYAKSISSELAYKYNVKFVLGHACSSATRAALSIYRKEKMVVISPTARQPYLTKKGEYPNFFRLVDSGEDQAKLQAYFIVNGLKFRKVAIAYSSGNFGESMKIYQQKYLSRYPKLNIRLVEAFPPDLKDFSALMEKIEASKAEVALFNGKPFHIAMALQEALRLGIETIFISGDIVKDRTFIEKAGDSFEDLIVTGPSLSVDSKLFIEAKEDHIRKYKKEPGTYYLNAYSAAMVLFSAIKMANSTDYSAVIKVLKSKQFETPLGKIRFNPDGDTVFPKMDLYQGKKGRFMRISADVCPCKPCCPQS